MPLAKALTALKNETLSSIYKNHYRRLDLLFAGGSLEIPYGLQGISCSSDCDEINPERFFETSMEFLARQVPEACDELIFRPLSLCFNPHGVHFIDDIFGAEVFLHPFSEQWQAWPLQSQVGTLHRPDVDNNSSWKLVKDVAELFLEYDPPNVTLEMPTIASALNIGVNLYGQELLIAMLSDPEAAKRDLRVINDVIKELHSWFLDRLPIDRFQCIAMAGRFQPHGHGQICGCTTQLLSKQLYEEFVAPLDVEVLSLYPEGGMIHLCGAHTQHLASWETMQELKAVQLNDRAATDLTDYFNGLRKGQIIYLNYFEDMPLEKALQITNGERLVLVGEFDESERNALKQNAISLKKGKLRKQKDGTIEDSGFAEECNANQQC